MSPPRTYTDALLGCVRFSGYVFQFVVQLKNGVWGPL